MNNNFDTVREALLHSKDAIIERGLDGNPDFAERWGLTLPLERIEQALTALAAIEADHFTASDMASAAAQGVRDGVASVTQGEPVAWMYESPMPDGSVFVGASAERLQIGVGVTPDSKEYPLYLGAAPVAQQPQEPDWKHPKIQALIGADARNRIVIDLIWQILKNPEGDFSAMDMEYWDSIHDAVQAAVTNAQQPQAEAVPPDVVRDAARYRQVRRGQKWSVIDGIGDDLIGDALDAAIDAAIAAQGAKT